uniref:Uncharacterized protein n=1 Tax=Lepeophtheirus salmonis TaxID=72036 RepID=A0A0K2TVR7_LEPSM
MTPSIITLAGFFEPPVNFTSGGASLRVFTIYRRLRELLTGSNEKKISSEKIRTFLLGFFNLLRRIFDRSSLFCLFKAFKPLTFVTALDFRANYSLKMHQKAVS